MKQSKQHSTLQCLSVQQQREGQGSGGVGVWFYLVFIIDGRLGLVNGLRLRLIPDFRGYWTLLDFRILMWKTPFLPFCYYLAQVTS